MDKGGAEKEPEINNFGSATKHENNRILYLFQRLALIMI